ncbi:MAG TPA: penicillin acylase family protein [Candidatus Binatia bacterium]|nr:penicillin acylase family protein [Candidatus Binatia bacterium]
MSRRALPAIFAVVLAAAAPAGAQLACNPLPPPLPGTVLRDAYGVPHVFAGDLDDLTFVNGYVEAQDRLFLMEIFRRAGKGTLSEILGADQLEMDIASRRDLYTAAERQAQFNALPAADRQSLTRFADGVNRYICEALLDPSKMPVEYQALGFVPDFWSALDSVAAADFLIGVFGAFGGDEVRNAAFFFDVKSRLRRGKAKRVFDDHFPLFDDQSPTTIPESEQTFDDPLRQSARRFASRQLRTLEQYLPSIYAAAGVAAAEAQSIATAEEALGIKAARGHFASNAILVSGAKSATGSPILLGGPQVGYAIPSFFFEVGLHLPSSGAVGVLPPAGPSIVIGRTDHFAYTITSGISDQVDTYLEVLNPADDHQYLFNGAFEAMTCRTESFTVKPPPTNPGPPSIEMRELCRTRHGPVFFNDGVAAFSHAFAHRNLELLSSANWLRMSQATSLAEFKQLVDGIAMSFNFHYADDQGTIAYFHAGTRPLRPARTDPRFPLIGTGEHEWQGVLPKSAMPGIVNPAQGWLANWNNNPVRGWSSADVRELWGTEHRVQALQDGVLRELAADGKLSADDVNLVMYEAAKKDEYAGGRSAFDGRPAVAGPFAALSVAVDTLPATDPDRTALAAGRDLMGAWVFAATPVTMTALETGAPVARTVHGAPLIDLDGDGFLEHTGAALYERWREILQHRVFDDELGSFVSPLEYDPAPGANTGDHGGGDTQDSVLLHALSGFGPSGKRTIRYFDDVGTRARETAAFQLVESLRQAMAELGDCLAPTPVVCRHANHLNVFSSLGAASDQTIGQTRNGVDRGSYNQIVECSTPAMFSVNVQPPGQSGFINAALFAQLQAASSDAARRQLMDAAHLTDQLELYERFEYKPMPFSLAEVQAAQ